jgi:hypothetical protein
MSRKSEEEKVAESFNKLLSNITLDLDQVGFYIGRVRPQTIHKRLDIILSAADEERNGDTDIDRFSTTNELF